MGKSKELSEIERNSIQTLSRIGKSELEISNELQVPLSTVYATL